MSVTRMSRTYGRRLKLPSARTQCSALRRMEILRAIHLFLRIRRDKRREQRQQIEDRQHDAARDRQRALAHLRPEDDSRRLRRDVFEHIWIAFDGERIGG